MKYLLTILILIHCFSFTVYGDEINETKLLTVKTLYDQGDYEEAISYGLKLYRKQADKKDLQSAVICSYLALAHYKWYDFENAAIYSQKALSLLANKSGDSSFAEASIYVANMAYEQNNVTKAVEIFNSISIPDKQKDPEIYIRYEILNAKILKNSGHFKDALSKLDETDRFILTTDNHGKALEPYRIEIYTSKTQYLLAYGNVQEANTANKQLKEIIAVSEISEKYEFYFKYNEGLIYEFNKDYAQAAVSFLKATNISDWNEHHVLKQKALQLSAINTMRNGQWTQYKNLFRRIEMYSFRKSGKRQVFKPCVAELKILEAIETGRYKQASTRSNEALKQYQYLPQAHPDKINFLSYKQETSEYEGNLTDTRRYLDTLEMIVSVSFGSNSLALAEVKLQKAIYEVKYGGSLPAAKVLFSTYFDYFLEKNIYAFAPAKLDYLENYAKLFELLDNSDSALVRAKEGYNISSKTGAAYINETQYFQSLVALYQFNTGQYKDFIASLNSAFSVKTSGLDNMAFYIKSQYTQSYMFRILGEFEKMEKCIANVNRISLFKEEKKFFDRFQVLEELAALYIASSNYFKAERNLRSSIENKQEKAGRSSYILIAPVFQMADMKLQKGELKEADQFITKADDLTRLYFMNVPSRKAELNLLKSKYCIAISDYKKAIDLQNESIDIVSSVYGNHHVRLAPLYLDLAEIIIKEKASNTALAYQIYEKAKEIIADGLGKKTPIYANLLLKEAELLITLNDFSTAGVNLAEAEKFWTSKFGTENVNIAEIIFVKGNLHFARKKYNDADDAYKQTAQLYSSLFNKNHTGYLKSTVGRAKVAYMQKEYDRASDFMKPILDARLSFADNNFSIMSFSQKTIYWNGFREDFELFNSIIYSLNLKKSQNQQNGQMYNYALRTKGLLLNSDTKLRKRVLSSGDSTLSAFYQEWLAQKEYFALISTYSKKQLEEESVSVESLELYIENLEKSINAKTDNSMSSNKIYEWKDVKRSLPEKSMAVEILRFRYFNQTFTDTIIYASLTLGQGDNTGPNAIFTNEGKQMEGSYLRYYRNSSITKFEDENSYDVYLKPLKANIPDGTTVFLSSEGVYNQLNPEMLYNSGTQKYAIEANTFVFVSTTKDLVTEQEIKKTTNAPPANTTYYLYGNPQFYTQKLTGRKDTVANLVGAEREIEDINTVLLKNNKNTVKLIGAPVTEDTIRAIENPTVLHIATHGFFMDSKNESTPAKNPMLNSGLMLTGSGNIVADLGKSYINQTPGMLTASEVMELNYSNTQLVVLSACETGRGQVEVGEGVYGLQRAFLIAGAKTIILSLFKVDDEATRLLMQKFYEKSIVNGGDYRKAFREAKQELRNTKEFEKPIYWGSFIMIEGKPGKLYLN